MDIPQQNGQRTIIIPADPIPIQNPRPDPHMFMGQSSDPYQFQSGAPNTLATEDGAPLLSEPVGSQDSMLLITEIAEPLTTTAINNFIAVGKTTDVNPRASMMISPNGSTWTEVTLSPLLGDVELLSVAYGNGTWVAVGSVISSDSAIILTSADGITWTLQSSPVSDGVAFYGVTYGSGKFVAVGYDSSSSAGKVLTSTDGVSWQLASSIINRILLCVAYGSGMYVACGGRDTIGESPVIYTSPDAVTWTLRPQSMTGTLRAVAHNGSMFVAVGFDEITNTPLILTSSDGITWVQPSYVFTGSSLTAVVYGDDTWITVGNAALTPNESITVFISTDDGVTWESRSDQNFNLGHPSGLSYSGATGAIVAIGSNSDAPFIYLSTDGQTWQSLTTGVPANAVYNAVAFGVATGQP